MMHLKLWKHAKERSNFHLHLYALGFCLLFIPFIRINQLNVTILHGIFVKGVAINPDSEKALRYYDKKSTLL